MSILKELESLIVKFHQCLDCRYFEGRQFSHCPNCDSVRIEEREKVFRVPEFTSKTGL